MVKLFKVKLKGSPGAADSLPEVQAGDPPVKESAV